MTSTRISPSAAGPDGSPAVQIHARGLAVLDDPEVNRGTAFTMAERDHLGLHGLLPSAIETIERADGPVLRAVQGQGLRRREVGVPLPAARQQRGALLPAGRRARARDAADRLHAHGGRGHPGVQPPVPPAAGRLPQHRRRRRHRPGARRDRARCRTTSTWSSPPTPRRSSASATGASAASTSRSASSRSTRSPPASTPARVLAVGLDVGTNRESLLNDPRYLGLRRSRVRGEAYDKFIDTYVAAASARFPKAILHWEDFSGPPARGILARYGDTPVHLRRRHPGHRRGGPGLRAGRGPGLRRSPGRPADRGVRRRARPGSASPT